MVCRASRHPIELPGRAHGLRLRRREAILGFEEQLPQARRELDAGFGLLPAMAERRVDGFARLSGGQGPREGGGDRRQAPAARRRSPELATQHVDFQKFYS